MPDVYVCVSIEEAQGRPVSYVGCHPIVWYRHEERPAVAFVRVCCARCKYYLVRDEEADWCALRWEPVSSSNWVCPSFAFAEPEKEDD